MIRVNLIARDNGFGLSHHLRLLRDVLAEAGFEVTVLTELVITTW